MTTHTGKFNIKLTFNVMFSPGLEELQFKFSEGTKNIYFSKAGLSRLLGCGDVSVCDERTSTQSGCGSG